MGKSTLRTRNYRQDPSRKTVALATFRQQMADFARAEKLVQLREKKRLSQEAAASEIGVSTKSLRAWEHGGGIRWHNAKRLGEFYGVDPESLLVQEPDRSDGDRDTPDLMGAINGDVSQLDRIEAKLDLLLQGLAADEATQRDRLAQWRQDVGERARDIAARSARPPEHPRRS